MKIMITCLVALVSVSSLSLISCDKAKKLADVTAQKIKELKGEGDEKEDGALVTSVTSVGEAEGKEIIKNEKRLVILEFYSDT